MSVGELVSLYPELWVHLRCTQTASPNAPYIVLIVDKSDFTSMCSTRNGRPCLPAKYYEEDFRYPSEKRRTMPLLGAPLFGDFSSMDAAATALAKKVSEHCDNENAGATFTFP